MQDLSAGRALGVLWRGYILSAFHGSWALAVKRNLPCPPVFNTLLGPMGLLEAQRADFLTWPINEKSESFLFPRTPSSSLYSYKFNRACDNDD